VAKISCRGDDEKSKNAPRPAISSLDHSVENPTFKFLDHRKRGDFPYSSPRERYEEKINVGYVQN
jgi:hypothetical protein